MKKKLVLIIILWESSFDLVPKDNALGAKDCRFKIM